MALIEGIDLDALTTAERLSWLWVQACRQVGDVSVDWWQVRSHLESRLAEVAALGVEPDPETWGLTPDAIAMQQRLTGGADHGGSPV